MVGSSVTKQEIAYYWKQKRLIEEDHLYAAIKAAARVRARNLTEYDILRFEASLKDDEDQFNDEENVTEVFSEHDQCQEMRVGIKDWWTKSKYAYLNEPSVNRPRQRSCTYVPQFFIYKCSNSYTTTYGFPQDAFYAVK